jgi:hypothetical protein
LGLNDGFISTWSPYFELREKIEGLTFSWENSTAPVTYRSRREFPHVPVGTLSLSNPHPYPVLIRLVRSFPVELIPFCPTSQKSDSLIRSTFVQFHTGGEAEVLAEQSDAVLFRLGSGGRVQANYALIGQIECRCPIREDVVDRRRTHWPWGDHEAGYFFRLIPTPPLVELVDSNNGQPDRGIAVVVPPMASGFRWAGNFPPGFNIPLRMEEPMIATRPVTPGLCK